MVALPYLPVNNVVLLADKRVVLIPITLPPDSTFAARPS
jgi:hypothetical protein